MRPTSSRSLCLPPARMHFCDEVARLNGGTSSPRKYGLNGTMPATVNSTVGSCGMRLADGTIVWSRSDEEIGEGAAQLVRGHWTSAWSDQPTGEVSALRADSVRPIPRQSDDDRVAAVWRSPRHASGWSHVGRVQRRGMRTLITRRVRRVGEVCTSTHFDQLRRPIELGAQLRLLLMHPEASFANASRTLFAALLQQRTASRPRRRASPSAAPTSYPRPPPRRRP